MLKYLLLILFLSVGNYKAYANAFLTADLKLHIPWLQYLGHNQTLLFWGNLSYVPAVDDEIYFELESYGNYKGVVEDAANAPILNENFDLNIPVLTYQSGDNNLLLSANLSFTPGVNGEMRFKVEDYQILDSALSTAAKTNIESSFSTTARRDSSSLYEQDNAQTDRTLLAIFAHADDELVISPLLAHYARTGVNVYVVIVTRGETWAPMTDITAGDQIATMRAKEASCAAQAMGIQEPILLGFDDNSLGERTQASWIVLKRVENEIIRLFAELQPDVVITWGPEGGYGHPDHRLVGAVVTQVVQQKVDGYPAHLLYPSIPLEQMPEGTNPADLPWLPLAMEYLTVQVPYTDADMQAATSAISCYTSQFTEDVIRLLPQQFQEVFQGNIYLRPWFGSASGNNIFILQ
jgi:LmbE family N-acetylglucosaminyl deacetylase